MFEGYKRPIGVLRNYAARINAEPGGYPVLHEHPVAGASFDTERLVWQGVRLRNARVLEDDAGPMLVVDGTADLDVPDARMWLQAILLGETNTSLSMEETPVDLQIDANGKLTTSRFDLTGVASTRTPMRHGTWIWQRDINALVAVLSASPQRVACSR